MNRKEIIQRSVEIANSGGLAGVTIANLARSFRVKPPSLYKHISGIDEVHDELGVICLSSLIRIIQSDGFGLSGDQALSHFFHASRRFALGNPGLYQAMQRTHLQRNAEYQQQAETLIGMIMKLLSFYGVKSQDMIHVIRNLRALLHGFIDLELQNGFGLPESIEESFTRAVDNFISPLRNHGRSRRKNK